MEKGLRNSNQIVPIFFIRTRGGHLGFQNGRHFQHILAYISTSELPSQLKMVPIPMFMMLRGVIKAFGKLHFVIFGGHLKFQNGRHLDFKMAAIFNIFWTVTQLASYV